MLRTCVNLNLRRANVVCAMRCRKAGRCACAKTAEKYPQRCTVSTAIGPRPRRWGEGTSRHQCNTFWSRRPPRETRLKSIAVGRGKAEEAVPKTGKRPICKCKRCVPCGAHSTPPASAFGRGTGMQNGTRICRSYTKKCGCSHYSLKVFGSRVSSTIIPFMSIPAQSEAVCQQEPAQS